jgi:hypothetical protein
MTENKSKKLAPVSDPAGAFLAVINTEQDALSAFLSRSLVRLTTATADYLVANEGTVNEKGKPISRESLFRPIADSGAVSMATLRRWATVADEHKRLGIPQTEATASAVYALTESGMTEARNALKAIKPEDVSDGDALVAAVSEAINSHPKKVQEITTGEDVADVTPEDVTGAPFSPDAFRESVRALLAQVSDEDQTEARKILRAFANEKVSA